MQYDYDEQPVGFVQSWSQRSRWTVGIFNVFMNIQRN